MIGMSRMTMKGMAGIKSEKVAHARVYFFEATARSLEIFCAPLHAPLLSQLVFRAVTPETMRCVHVMDLGSDNFLTPFPAALCLSQAAQTNSTANVFDPLH